MRRYTAMKPSKGTQWPREVRAAILLRDGGCVGPRVGMPGDCFGALELDHVRASHGIGMKSPSTVDNGVAVCSTHHRVKTDHGRTWRPRLIEYVTLQAFGSALGGDYCVHVDPHPGCDGPCNRVRAS